MKKFKVAILSFVLLGTLIIPTQASGFLEDSKVDIMNRSFYFYRDFRKGASNTTGPNLRLPPEERGGYRSEWAYGIIGQFQSGYTNTPIQFGIDLYGMAGFKLYSDELKTGTNLLPFDPYNGKAKDAYGEIGGAIKLKFKETSIIYGNQFPAVPVISVSTARLLPSTATGITLQDKSFDNLTINAGHFYRMNPVDSTKHLNYFTTDYAAGIRANSISYVGGSYQLNDVTYTAYASQLEDIWNQYYFGANTTYKLPMEGHALRFATANYYNKASGSRKFGDINSLAISALLGYQINNHVFSIGYQQILGDDPMDWVGFSTMGANIALLNAGQFATFSEAKEKSVQAKYEVDFGEYGIPGLSLMARYIYGWDVNNAQSSKVYQQRYIYKAGVDYTHWERDITLAYKVPSGFAKGLDMKLRQATHRSTKGYRYNDIDELRVIFEYPISF